MRWRPVSRVHLGHVDIEVGIAPRANPRRTEIAERGPRTTGNERFSNIHELAKRAPVCR